MASKALLLDMNDNKKQMYVMPPPMIGFFEFALMRTGGHFNQKLLSELFYQYIETEEEFMETYSFCKEMNFSKIHVFPFSDRKGTVAYKMVPKVTPEVKKDRVSRLILLSNMLGQKYDNIFANRKIEFLFENYDQKRKAYRGHSSNYLETYYPSSENLTGKVLTVPYISIFDNVKNNLFDGIDD